MPRLSRSELLHLVSASTPSHGAVALDPDVFEDAFPLTAATSVVEVLRHAEVVVLGGDFWELADDGRMKPTGSNWYYVGSDAAVSVRKATQALTQAWLRPTWFVTFTWR